MNLSSQNGYTDHRNVYSDSNALYNLNKSADYATSSVNYYA